MIDLATPPLPATELERLAARFPERTVALGRDVQVSVRECGTGGGADLPLVCLHGIGSGAASWLETAALLADIPNLTTFAVEGAADLVAEALKPEPFAIGFDLITGGAGYHVKLSVPGRHNVSNALAAIGASVAAGVPLIDAIRAVERFTGLKRRFEKVERLDEIRQPVRRGGRRTQPYLR